MLQKQKNNQNPTRGKLITLEGCDGAGKSTQAKILANKLAEIGIDAVTTFEPGGSPGSAAIRKILFTKWQNSENKSSGIEVFSAFEQMILHYAARFEHIREKIEPALAQGKWVVCDRYVDSTRVYQTCQFNNDPHSNLFSKEEFDSMLFQHEQILKAKHWPAITIILALNSNNAIERINSRKKDQVTLNSTTNNANTEIESDNSDWLNEISAGFDEIASANPNRCHIVRADQSIKTVSDNIWQKVSCIL